MNELALLLATHLGTGVVIATILVLSALMAAGSTHGPRR